MKVVAINGSARKDGNTAIMVRRAFGPLEEAGIETELIQLAGQKMHGCIACYKCMENKDAAARSKTISSTSVSPRWSRPTGSSWPRRPISPT